ncbi:head GIN domain-containing protein [Arenibacter sp. F20364]|uniref:head GIN domain-containing protein n=1 Tax=Arenibacter sp. F20364 TaxID=2926415 RepID=UPI001FF33714|nr:head GIN domain-containing protein [Arenibacter sp. F20364]MCK0188483.1 DUF2807 domain-containing protein [Arenibacter sp. F20364]
MKHLATSLFLLLSLSCISAQKNNRGNMTTVVRSTPSYDHIAISGSFDIELVDGQEGEITLEGEENILNHIITEVKGNKLNIRFKKGFPNRTYWKKQVSITIPIESINGLSLSGSGDIVGNKSIKTDYFETSMSGSGDIALILEANSVKASMSGSGDITLSGNTNNLEVFISGSGDIKAYDLIADNVDATVSGSANVEVTANKSINAKVSGSGDIDYRGNPEKISSKVSGSGDITEH